jgi:hypothetical protein
MVVGRFDLPTEDESEAVGEKSAYEVLSLGAPI